MCSVHKMLLVCWNKEELDGRGMWHVWTPYQPIRHAYTYTAVLRLAIG